MMNFNLDGILNQNDFQKYSQQLSEEGKNSEVTNLVKGQYMTVMVYFNKLKSSFSYCRDENGYAQILSTSDLGSKSSRLQFELIAFVTLLLKDLPDLEKVIDSDSQTNETDKILLKSAYHNLKSTITTLNIMYGQPCFGFKKEEKKAE